MIGSKITNYHLTIPKLVTYCSANIHIFRLTPNFLFIWIIVKSKSNSVKYLGLSIDDKFNWSAHAQYIFLQLAKCCSMLYQVRGCVTNQTSIMLHNSFACSRISNEITAWGTAADKYLKEIETKQNNIVWTIIWNKKFLRVTQLYKNLKLLKMRDNYNLELAKFINYIKSTTIKLLSYFKINLPN